MLRMCEQTLMTYMVEQGLIEALRVDDLFVPVD